MCDGFKTNVPSYVERVGETDETVTMTKKPRHKGS